MRLISLDEYTTEPVSIALGYFDCLHRGHRALLNAAREHAGPGISTAMFTFDNEPTRLLNPSVRSVYSFETRCRLAERFGTEIIVYADFDESLRRLSPEAFFERLSSAVDIRTIVCGQDYTYGAGGAGTVESLGALCLRRGIELVVVDDVEEGGEKVSSTRIRAALLDGNVERANALLGEPYRMVGIVGHGRGDGKTYSTPTANFEPDPNLLCPAFGVYATHVERNGKAYRAVTNLGAKPTFGDLRVTAETFIIGYNGNLYGNEITVEFLFRLRDIRKFDTKEELYEQIEKDKEWER